MVTTTPTLEGHEIVRYHGVVTGHAILGANVLRDWLAGWRDFFGGRARSYEAVLRDAEGAALREMSAKAQADGANAVVGVDLDYETIQVKGSMLMVIATGTAVTMVPKSR